MCLPNTAASQSWTRRSRVQRQEASSGAGRRVQDLRVEKPGHERASAAPPSPAPPPRSGLPARRRCPPRSPSRASAMAPRLKKCLRTTSPCKPAAAQPTASNRVSKFEAWNFESTENLAKIKMGSVLEEDKFNKEVEGNFPAYCTSLVGCVKSYKSSALRTLRICDNSPVNEPYPHDQTQSKDDPKNNIPCALVSAVTFVQPSEAGICRG
jgi:hypothetical protein